MVNSPARIERREYKYLVDEPMARSIQLGIQPFCDLDPYAKKSPTGCYTIDSCYLDSPDLALYRASEQELLERFKLRARSYPDSGEDAVFLEVKRRYNDVILKSRGRISRELYAQLLASPDAAILAAVPENQREAVESFLGLTYRYEARPVMMVRYTREAWVSQIDDYARVTFDRQIRSRPYKELSWDDPGGDWRYIDSTELQKSTRSLTLVELKFSTAVPRWMSHLVQRLDLLRTAYSKYGSAVRAWHQTPYYHTSTLHSGKP